MSPTGSTQLDGGTVQELVLSGGKKTTKQIRLMSVSVWDRASDSRTATRVSRCYLSGFVLVRLQDVVPRQNQRHELKENVVFKPLSAQLQRLLLVLAGRRLDSRRAPSDLCSVCRRLSCTRSEASLSVSSLCPSTSLALILILQWCSLALK